MTPLWWALSYVAFAQSPEPEFEAASIKPSGPIESNSFVGWRGGPGTDDPSRYACTYCGLGMLIVNAYEIPFYQLSNANRLPNTRFHVIAAVPAGTSKAQFHQMLQNLLAERFGLVVHRETHEMDTLRLLVADGGLKVKPYVEGEPRRAPNMRAPGIYYYEQGKTMAEFANFVAGYFAKPVIDATGLDEKYDFDLWFTNDLEDRNAPTLGSAIKAEGLRVESQKAPVEMIVIDHAEKTPTEN